MKKTKKLYLLEFDNHNFNCVYLASKPPNLNKRYKLTKGKKSKISGCEVVDYWIAKTFKNGTIFEFDEHFKKLIINKGVQVLKKTMLGNLKTVRFAHKMEEII